MAPLWQRTRCSLYSTAALQQELLLLQGSGTVTAEPPVVLEDGIHCCGICRYSAWQSSTTPGILALASERQETEGAFHLEMKEGCIPSLLVTCGSSKMLSILKEVPSFFPRKYSDFLSIRSKFTKIKSGL